MHIIYLGIMTKPEDIGKIGETSVAGNKMQYNLLKYLSKYENLKIDIVSFHPYKSFRKSKKLFVKKTKEKLFDNVDMYQVGYINLPILKNLIIPLTTKKMCKKLLKSKDDILMSFDIYPNQGIPMTKLAKKVENKTICFLADLSIGGVVQSRGLKKILRKMYDKNTLSNMRKCKHYITLNEYTIKQYAPDSKYIVIDGGIEPSEFNNQFSWDGKEKNVIYTGALVDYSGIMTLIEAMDKINNKDIVLDIYGDGVLKDKIIEIAKDNHRIRYHGKVDNQTAMKAQQTAWLLANPRPTEHSIAKVTFPSKIFEYLMSNRPVMTTRLNGFSTDYDELLFWVEDDTATGLANCINDIDSIDNQELLNIANKARNYLLKNKTWEINASKINKFIEDTFKK